MSEEPEQEKSGQEQGSQNDSRENAPPENALPKNAAKEPRRASLWHRHALLLLWLGALALMLMFVMLWLAHYVNSPQFRERVRRYAVAKIERASGGRVELE